MTTHIRTLNRIAEMQHFLGVDDLKPVLLELFAAGFSGTQVADKIGTTAHGLRPILSHFGIEKPARVKDYGKARIQQRHGKSPEALLADLCEQAKTVKEIAEALGISISTSRRWCKLYNLEPKRGEQPVAHQRLIRHNGLEMNMKQWAEHLDLPQSTLSRRISTGRELKYVLVPWQWPKALEGVNFDILVTMKQAGFEPEDLQRLLVSVRGVALGQRQIKQRLRTLQSHGYVRRYIFEDSGRESPYWELTEKGKRVLRGEKP